MELPVPKALKNLWEAWEIRSFILFSLFLQCFLILFSPLRKRFSNIWIYMSIWSAYLLADWVAGFAVGLISSSQGNDPCKSKKGSATNPDLYAFWVSFLLVHLGGPDTITAFALEDNELWRRHMLTLIFQSISAMYVFYQTLPKNQLWIPTMLMFVSGIIKYGERTFSLLSASLDAFRDKILREADPGPNYAKLMNEYHAMKEAHLPTSIKMFDEPKESKTVNRVRGGRLTRTEVVLHAHHLFEMFKGLIVGIILSFRERNQCREFFNKRTAKDSFDVIETELNLMYDVLFTKANVVYTVHGCILRFVCASLVVTSLYLFYFEQKANFKKSDVVITYTLLIGAIALDCISLIMFASSDWLNIFIHKLPAVNMRILEWDKEAVGAKKSRVQRWWSESVIRRKLHNLVRRWSESVSSFNLIYYAKHGRDEVEENIFNFLALTSFLDRLMYLERKELTEDLKSLIFRELHLKSQIADDLDTAKALSNAKGDWAIQDEHCDQFLHYVLKVDYDQSLLLWHIATELCYWDESDQDKKNKDRDCSKLLSDYMLYLLVMQPTMMSAVAGIGQIRFRDTCADAKKFFAKKEEEVNGLIIWIRKNGNWMSWTLYVWAILKIIYRGVICLLYPLLALVVSFYIVLLLPLVAAIANTVSSEWHKKVKEHYLDIFKHYSRMKDNRKTEHVNCCKNILEVHTEVKPETVKGEKSKSVLFDGCILAKELRTKKNKWSIMSRVWVELLSYAAINCRADNHVQQLSRGGELLTVVWLLMIQFGLGTQFQIEEGHSRAKLTVGK
ncbi:uncharacterized protein LOC127249579 isoform X2 [Andrographis paniculata]|nr:uncharacterized protein LOC127249579 isoform X2 [Andrographis paniculata]XP_051128433.1 uncharacterized protein LOC127249579 isoform X2 [Andrographis paniculata]